MKTGPENSVRHTGRTAGRRGTPATVDTVVRATGVPAHVVRYYARIGLIKPRRDPRNGYKLFTAAQRRRLLFIRKARHLGYTLREIRALLQDADRAASPCPRARQIIQRRIAENRRGLAELSRLQQRLERALSRWRRLPDGVPDGHTVCHLIEAVADDRASD